MKLLICTQYSDPADPALGFFARWIEEFKKHCEVEVISRRELGQGGRLARAWRLIQLARSKQYDTVFVHMNPEYLIAAGWYWRLRGIRVGFWYMHKAVNVRLRIAEKFANVIFTGSKESFRLGSTKVHIVGHGIDTTFFTPAPGVVRGAHWLSVGRLNKSKRHDLAIRLAHEAGKELRIVGDGPERSSLEELARTLGIRVTFVGALTQEGVRDEFRRAALFVHTSETGSLDKVVLEALACGCSVVTQDPALKFLERLSVQAGEGPDYVRREHSLKRLIPRILQEYEKRG